VLARVIYGFRLSVTFALLATFITSVIGIFMGAIQGYYGGWVDLFWQRIIEIWNATPQLYVIIIMAAIFQMNFWLLLFLIVLFGWMGLVRASCARSSCARATSNTYARRGPWACPT
jgi:microcin C transport system permease protein